jgi:ATP-binding cassette, subfamily B, bacterial
LLDSVLDNDGDRLLVGLVRRAGRWLGPLLVLGVGGSAALVALPAVLGRAVDQIVTASSSASAGDWAAARGSMLLAAGLIGVVVAEEALGQLIGGAGTARATGELRRRLARHVLAAGPGLTRRTAAGDVVARLVGGTAAASRVVVAVAGLAGTLIPPVGGLVALALIDPWLAVTFAVGMALAGGAVRAYLRDARVANAGYLSAQGAIAGRLVDALAGARTIGAARTVDREVDRILSPLPDLRRHGVAAWRTMAQLAFQGEPVVLLTQVAVVVVAGLGLAAGRLSPGEMLAASRYAVMAAGIGGMISQLSSLSRARAGASRVAEVLEAPAMAYGSRPLPAGAGRLELRGVTAWPPAAPPAGPTATGTDAGTGTEAGPAAGPAASGAPAGARTGAESGSDPGRGPRAGAPVLDGLDLAVPGGSVVALVGRSGAGKSLVAALAGRLCDPAAGEVRLDGVPLHELSRRSLRRAVAYAFDRPALLGGGTTTVGSAIGFGAEAASVARIRQAASAARADRFVDRLPGGYSAPLADTPLSGGELQRLGLARALAQDARLLILDDATSSLDTATEAEIASVLTAHAGDRTRLIVTHRTTTAARADLVAWLDAGRIRALGPHRSLWADPAYRAIFRPDPAPRRPPMRVPAPTPAATRPTVPATAPAPTSAASDGMAPTQAAPGRGTHGRRE